MSMELANWDSNFYTVYTYVKWISLCFIEEHRCLQPGHCVGQGIIGQEREDLKVEKVLDEAEGATIVQEIAMVDLITLSISTHHSRLIIIFGLKPVFFRKVP